MNQPEQPNRLEPHINDRGLAYMPIIDGIIRGTSVNIHDSSNAELDCLWIEASGYHNREDGGIAHAAEITIDDALILAAQIYALAERRGYSTAASRASRTHPAGALTFPPGANPQKGDIVRYSYADDHYIGRIRAIRDDGTIETEPVDLPLGHEFTPITGMLGNELDECGHRADGTELTRCGYPRADHEPATDEDHAKLTEALRYANSCNAAMKEHLDRARAINRHVARDVLAAREAASGDASQDVLTALDRAARLLDLPATESSCKAEERIGGIMVTHAPDCDGIQCGNSTVVPLDPKPLVTQVDPNTERFERVDANIAGLADRLEYLERSYREVPRPQDVGQLAAHLAKIERLESELAERDRELKAHKDVLAQVGTERYRLAEQLQTRTPSHRQVVLIEGLLTAVERGVDPAEHPLDVPPGVAGRVADALVKARTDGIVAFVSRQSVEYRKHSAAAVDEDRALAVRMGVAPSRFLDDGELSESESDAAAVIIKAGGEFATSVEGAVAAAEREANTDE